MSAPSSGSEAAWDSDASSNPEPRPSLTAHQKLAFRHATAAERTLARSLADLRANDLALHLFCVHHLKRRLYNDDYATASYQAKERRLGGRWHVSKRWTAWPAFPEAVPRLLETFGSAGAADPNDDKWTVKAETGGRPSEELEGLLLGYMQKLARERFEAREWAAEEDSESGASAPKKGRQERQDSEDVDVEEPEVVAQESETVLVPTPTLDDDEANRMLKPTIRHVLQGLDDLLTGMHTARANKTPPVISQDSKHRRLESLKRTELTQSEFAIKFQGQMLRYPRDWSDVIGMASLKGIDPHIVRNAAARCAHLFDEDMELRDLHEDPTRATEATSVRDGYMPYESFSNDYRYAGQTIPHVAQKRYRCPIDNHGRDRTILKFNTIEELKCHMEEAHRSKYAFWKAANKPHLADVFDLSRLCRVPGCKEWWRVFNDQYDVRKHVERAHNEVHPGPELVSTPENDPEEMYGGVHVDGYLKPISLGSIQRLLERDIRKRMTENQAQTRKKRKRMGAASTDGSEVAEETDKEIKAALPTKDKLAIRKEKLRQKREQLKVDHEWPAAESTPGEGDAAVQPAAVQRAKAKPPRINSVTSAGGGGVDEPAEPKKSEKRPPKRFHVPGMASFRLDINKE